MLMTIPHICIKAVCVMSVTLQIQFFPGLCFFGMSHCSDMLIAVTAGFTLHLTILTWTFKGGWKIITLSWNVP